MLFLFALAAALCSAILLPINFISILVRIFPLTSEDVHRFRVEVIVYETCLKFLVICLMFLSKFFIFTCVNREKTHEKNHITTTEKGIEYLNWHSISLCFGNEIKILRIVYMNVSTVGYFLSKMTSSLIFIAMSLRSKPTSRRAAISMTAPWPASPNITANKNGNVMMVHGAEIGAVYTFNVTE